MNKGAMNQFTYSIIFVGFIVLLTLRFVPGARHFINDFMTPFADSKTIIGSADPSLSKSKLRAELAVANQELNSKNFKIKEEIYLDRIDELTRLLHVNTPAGFAKKGAMVLQRDPASGNRTFRINCGSNDGVEVGQAVLAGDYLVGRILETAANTSVVTTVSDPNCHVAVRVADLTRADGVLFGQGEELWRQSPYCLLRYLPRDLNYEEGMLVVTSENSDQMPEGIPVGSIEPNGKQEMVETIDQLHKSAWVRPKALEADFSFVIVLVRRK